MISPTEALSRKQAPHPAGAASVLAGGGEMGALMRAMDWSKTGLGPVENWPQSLCSAVGICLGSRFPIVIYWGPGRVVLYNDAYAEILGKKHPWALGRQCREVWSEIWDVIEPMLDGVMTSGEATWSDDQVLFLERRGYSEECYFSFSFSPVRCANGKTDGIFTAVIETTRRVLGERRLRTLRDLAARAGAAKEEDEAWLGAVEALRDNPQDVPFALLYRTDASGKTAQLAGAAGAEAGAGHAPLAIDLASAPDSLWPNDRSAAAVLPISRPGVPAYGYLIVGLSAHRAFDEEYRGFLDLMAEHVATGIANARAYEEEKKRAAALTELDRAKTAFFSNVSHEFRTPLTLMLGPAEEAIADHDTLPANRERLAVVHRNALRLLKLVNSLLDFSRIEAGRIEASYEPTDLAAYTAELASNFRAAVEKAGMRLVVDSPPLPEPVYVDRDMWEKIVLNLLSNAFKHTFEGEIAVRVRSTHDHAELEVADTGVGIAAAELPRVFDRFHRVPNVRSRTHEGTGIGLALVQELVRLHGGHVNVASREGEGTTFVVRLPFGTAHLPADRVGAARQSAVGRTGATAYMKEVLRWLPGESGTDALSRAPSADADSDLGAPAQAGRTAGARVLVADDNADMREYVARLLRSHGCAIEAVGDGRAALDAAIARRPDLVLSDVMMPGLDGFALLRALRADERTRDVPVILLSARAGEEATVEGLGAGADDYLVKPFSARELAARVDAQLMMARIRREAEAALRESEARFRNMADYAPVMLWVTEADGSCSFLNRQWYEFTGQTPETGLGFGWLDATHPDDHEEAAAAFVRANETREPFRLEYRLRCADGEYRRAVDAAAPRFGPGGEFLGYIGSVVDIEERLRLFEAERAARAEAEDARQAAEAANQAKSQFLAAMSHELRTPLNAIAGYVQLLAMDIHGSVTDAQRGVLARIQRSEQHLLSLINDVLNFAKLEAGRVEYAVSDIPVASVLADAAPMIESQIAAKGLSYEVRVAPDVAVRADRDKLQQILLNLLSNAAKFTEPGGRITVDTARGDGLGSGPDGGRPGAVLLRVADTGVGIPRDKQDSIFDPFVQVHRNLTRTTEGTGLGLAISRDLARGMGGDLTVRSDEGRGSTFTLALPAADAASY